MDIIDPLAIRDLPVIVLADDRRSFLGWAIKKHTFGNYNHVMELIDQGTVATQLWNGYKELPIGAYMKPQIQLKFWLYKPSHAPDIKKWLDTIQGDLNAPWMRRRYDFLGCFGQFLRSITGLNLSWINNPFTRYCSERVAEHLRECFGAAYPLHPTPSELNRLFKSDHRMRLLGYWISD